VELKPVGMWKFVNAVEQSLLIVIKN